MAKRSLSRLANPRVAAKDSRPEDLPRILSRRGPRPLRPWRIPAEAQNFWLGGKTVSIGDFQLPISEGIIDRRWLGVGIAVLRNIERREPLLFALGMGESSEAMPRLLAASGWSLTPVPFFLPHRPPLPLPAQHRLPSPQASLANSAGLPGRQRGGRAWHQGAPGRSARAHRPSKETSIELVEEFGSWADNVWEACKGKYGFCAVRNTETLRVLYPREDARFVRLRVWRAGGSSAGPCS